MKCQVIHLIKEIGGSELGGRTLNEGEVTLENMKNAQEAFCTGTATVISPIEHIGEKGGAGFDYQNMGPVTTKLRKILTDIQSEQQPDAYNWLRDPFEDSFWSV